MSSFEIIRCRHKSYAPCNRCEQQKRCQVTPIVCDANAIASAFLNEPGSGVSLELLHSNRRNHRIAVTNEILGETVSAIIRGSRDAELIDKNLSELKQHIINFDNRGSLYHCEGFRELLDALLENNVLRCGPADRMHIAAAAYLDCKFFTFDASIIKDKGSIQKAARQSGHRFELYNFG